MNYIFDWDKKSKQGILKCNTLDIIREHFSVENKIAKITEVACKLSGKFG